MDAYFEIVERILSSVRLGLRVCAAFYGHPGVFAYPSHRAISQARAEGYFAVMLPGVSAESCMFADLGVDPGDQGCQSYEATDFLLSKPKIDPRAALVLWQIGLVGHSEHRLQYPNVGISLLLEALGYIYSPSYIVILYESASYAVCESRIEQISIRDLAYAQMTTATTLYVPPLAKFNPK